jgi:hypothetical protein
MDKRRCLLNNPSSESIRITELNLSLPPGICNLFDLNSAISYEQIDYSLRHGTLRAAMDNGLCYLVPDSSQKSFSDDVVIRKPLEVQILPSRARFTVVKNAESTVFDSEEDAGLFDDDVKPARQLEEEIKTKDNVQAVEATIKEANLPEKPIENRYAAPSIKAPEVQQKIKNDLTMGYETCNGKTADGKRCLRRAKTGKRFCGLHKDQG